MNLGKQSTLLMTLIKRSNGTLCQLYITIRKGYACHIKEFLTLEMLNLAIK